MSTYDNGCRLNVGAGDLAGASAAVSGSRATSVAVMDSNYRPNIGSGTKTEQTDVSGSGTDRRQGAKDDVVATKEVEYIKSFVVVGDDQAQKTDYVRKYLQQAESNNVKTRLVQLVISLSGIKVSDVTGQKTLMAHALKRIAFATCFPDLSQFTFIAREPRSSTDEQFCHAFRARSPHEAQELNALMAGAFRTAYAQSQSPSMSTRQLSRAAIDTLPPSASDELSGRLSHISTANVDELAADRRRQKRATAAANDTGHLSQQPGDVTTNVKKSSADHHQPVYHRAHSESPPSAMSSSTAVPASNVHRTSTAPVFTDTGSAATTSSTSVAARTWTTAPTTGVVSATTGSDIALMSTLLSALRNCSTTAGSSSSGSSCHGSPVMIVKDLIDRHFSAAAGVTSPLSAVSPVSKRLQSSRTDVAASSSSSRSRPLSDIFLSNGDVLCGADLLTSQPANCDSVPDNVLRLTDANSHSEDLRDAVWYQPGLPRDTVLDKLAQQDVGCFVIRDSTTHAGCYALSIRVDKHDVADQGISHYLITKTARGTVRLKGMSKEWNSLTALVTHHTVMKELLPCLLVLPTSTTSHNGHERTTSQC